MVVRSLGPAATAATAIAATLPPPSAYGIVAAEDEKGVMGDGLSQRGEREEGGRDEAI